ncbi:MAG: polyphosphate kinase 2 family protein [Myxococcales bacterium]|nr:polyphosphate kinase 2 family protein [Myxococcales bacterium]
MPKQVRKVSKRPAKKIAKGAYLFDAPPSPWLVPFDGTFSIAKARSAPKKSERGKAARPANRAALREHVGALYDLQQKLYADDRYGLLLVFQAMDAAGKDGTIRAVMTGVNPAGCHVTSFKGPTYEELDHDFLWRVAQKVPSRGTIGIFNRSHYEEVLIVRVHPEYLRGQRLPRVGDQIWEERYESIRDWERHLARNGTVILKFFLNVSRDEQKKRLLSRIDDPTKNWKFEASDLDTRERWDDYMEAYESALNATSTPWAPWYCVPADDKDFMRQQIAAIIHQTMASLPIDFPSVSDEKRAELGMHRKRLLEL